MQTYTVRFFGLVVVAALLSGAGCIRLGASPTGPMGVFRSVDNGDNWQPAMAYPTPQGVGSIAGVKVYRMFSDPGDPNSLYLATRGQGLFYTYNNGDSWQSVPALDGKFIYGVAVDPSDKCTIYVTDGTQIFKTSDCSRTWESAYAESRPNERFVGIALDYRDPRRVYGALLGGDLMMSVDAGKSWRVAHRFQTELQHVATDPLAPGRIYVASYKSGLFRSDNGGAKWLNISAGLEPFSGSFNFYRLVLHPGRPNSLFWVSKYGVLRSNDAGVTWQEVPLIPPPGSVNIYTFAVSPQTEQSLYLTATVLGDKNQPLRSTFYRSDDGGKSWITKKLPTNTIPIGMYINLATPTTILMGFTLPD